MHSGFQNIRKGLKVTLADEADVGYDDGFRCVGERAVIRKFLEIDEQGSNPRSRAVPAIPVVLGRIVGLDENSPPRLVARLNTRMNRRVPLLGIGTTEY